MKKHFVLLCLALTAIICSCTGQKSAETETSLDAGTQVYNFSDSCQHLILSLSLELPTGEDSVSALIRDSLTADFILAVQQSGFDMENAFPIKPYSGDMNNPQSIVDYYGKAAYDFLLKQAKSDYDSRMQYLEEDTTMTEEDRQRIKDDVPMWAFDLNVKRTTNTQDFVVYYSQAYVYYGGAHGGITGSGALTFDKNTGKKIPRFIASDATKAMQPLLRKGLLQYYSACGDTITDTQLSERLQIAGSIIPLPTNAAYPNTTGDSLTFTYRQYEIACYADGMPSFTLPVKDLLPYLTPEGKSTICK